MGLAQTMRMVEAAFGSPYYTLLLQEGMIPPAYECQRLVAALLASQRALADHGGYHATDSQEDALWDARAEVRKACKSVGINPDKLGEL